MNYVVGSASSDLAVRYHGPRSRPPKALRAWSEVFIQWHAVHRRYAVQEGDDIGWWWRERPSVSFLAAALWAAGGTGLQEYRISRQPKGGDEDDSHYGRADLYAALAGEQFQLEAKHWWVRLDTGGTEQTLQGQLDKANSDVETVNGGYDWEGALAFFTTHTRGKSRKETNELVRQFRRQEFPALADKFEHLFQVDLFPSWIQWKRIESADGDRHPGMTFFMGLRRCP